MAAGAQQPASNKANWTLSNMFADTATLRRVSYTTALVPNWINNGDSLWYNWRDRNACNFYVAYPRTRAKTLMFDHARLASQLSAMHKKPFDPTRLPFNTLEFAKDAKSVNFGVEGQRYEWSFAAQELRHLGRDSTANQNAGGGRGGRGNAGGAPTTPPIQYCQGGGAQRNPNIAAGFGGGGGGGRQGGPGGAAANVRNYSPDSTMFVFGRAYNVYLVNVAKNDTVQLSKDGEKDRSFAVAGFGGQQQQDTTQQQDQNTQNDSLRVLNTPVRVAADWAPDSKSFYVRRNDQRKVGELYLVNSLSNPRPTQMVYKYAMPGEENVTQQEVHLWRAGEPGLKEITTAKKWRDQQYNSFRWDTPTKLRFTRRDRLQRNLEYVEYDITTGSVTPLITESVVNANLEQPTVAYTAKENGDIIWWSERSGWGHYYLYDHNGKFKNAITSGQWRAASPIVALDSTRRVLYVSGLGREEGENPYYRHLYKVNLDGSALTLLDAGNAMHSPTPNALNAKKTFYVDNASRTDLIPKAVVRDELGKVVMELETTDMSSLREMGWKPSEPFMVKAADGITDIWGNMYKPFDFDSTRKYPIIAHVYPGPQTEGVTYNFAQPNSVPQRLANLGFIVVQLGNRGGSPDRSNAYQSFSYFNMRDYGLADKKAGLEQLAAKHRFIDIERVGIFGHSGGGFMTAAAMMLPPYNDFFKVGVSSAGNHDNNIYNQNWSEQYHGLAEIITPVTAVANGNGGGPRTGNGVQQQGSSGTAGSTRGNLAANGARVVKVNDTIRYEIRVPTTVELAPNLKGNLLLAHGDQDNNVTPSGTIRLMDALIRANKRFDFVMLPGQAHGFGPMQNYFNERLMEYFAEHLLGDYYRGSAEMKSKRP
ncbi:MAG TPA: DPP IV N-terminal domain-containing protein [Gemmatimonadaceae bacterium]|nr:DPP IV N-terminal domain-containing protein [Gemmatimonadaceae bacterium]